MIEERYELALDRIRLMQTEDTVGEPYRDYFKKMAEFVLMLDELRTELLDGRYQKLELDELRKWNRRLYQDVLPGQYEKSYANPDYACKMLGKESGQILGMLYAELRGAVVYVFEGKTEYLAILYELLIEIYNQFEDTPDAKTARDIFYWYASDYCDVFLADRIREQILPEESFATDLIMNSDLKDLRYLYQFGEYISENEWKTAEHLNRLPEETIQKMADVYSEGYRIGFVNTGKDLSKKSVVNIRYILGFERVVKKAIENFEKMGLKPVIYRAAVSVLTKRQHYKIGYCGAVANKQYEYDHREDEALFMDKKFVSRRLEVQKEAYEQKKELSAVHAGPAWIEVFGETPFTPVLQKEACQLSKKQQELSTWYYGQLGQIINSYIPGEERSFTIIAYPIPEIGEEYPAIMDETIRLNTLDYQTYEDLQQKMIDVLDTCEYARIIGTNGNKTDLKVMLTDLADPAKQTKFENCVADVNIPVGEVFTSPKLAGTEGTLYVSRVYLNELEYTELEIHVKDGRVTEYDCANFADPAEGKKLIKDNILYHHETLPMGEFAIGTNTTAYRMGRMYEIEDRLPILIAEKTGPHFAFGDTCYSHAEDVAVYNPDGKEIIARDNEISVLRKEDMDKAYFQCHTDITIPYDELGALYGVTADGEEKWIIKDGRFVLPGTEELNKPLEGM